jgi:hypothetical protein
MNVKNELDTLFLTEIKKIVSSNPVKSNKQFIDSSSRAMGFSKITKKGYTP